MNLPVATAAYRHRRRAAHHLRLRNGFDGIEIDELLAQQPRKKGVQNCSRVDRRLRAQVVVVYATPVVPEGG